MRQILIKQMSEVKSVSGNRFYFCLDSIRHDLAFAPNKVKVFRFPFTVKVISGGRIDLDFMLDKELAKEGIILLGAYLELGCVMASMMNLSDEIIHLEDKYPVLQGTLVEVASFRQVSEGTLGDIEIKPMPEKKKGKKKS